MSTILTNPSYVNDDPGLYRNLSHNVQDLLYRYYLDQAGATLVFLPGPESDAPVPVTSKLTE